MKTPRHFLFTGSFVAAILTATLPCMAQSTPAGGTPKKEAANEDAAPRKLAAPVTPQGEDGSAKGTIEFALVGNTLNVTGRVEGLEPMTKYRVTLQPEMSVREERVAVGPAAGSAAPLDAGTPDAGQPNAGKPLAPDPDAGLPDAGKPDGQIRTAGGSDTPSATSVNGAPDINLGNAGAGGDLTTITTDSTGGANLNATLRNMQFANGAASMVGRKLTIIPAAEPGGGINTKPVATATVQAASDGTATTPEKEDEASDE